MTCVSENYVKDDQKKKEYKTFNEKEFHELSPVLPLAPTPGVVQASLSTLPAQIEYWEELEIALQAQKDELKVLIKGRNRALEITKSQIRMEVMKKYQTKMKEFLPNVKQLFKDFENDPNMNKMIMQMLIKELKPEKPTKNDLDDLANLKTEQLQEEIFELEKQLVELESEYQAVRVKVNRYNNAYISVRAHIRMLEKQYDRS